MSNKTKLSLLQLTTTRSIVIERIKDNCTFATQALNDRLLQLQLKVRYEQVQTLYRQFQELSSEIIKLYASNQTDSTEDINSEKQITKEVDDCYYTICSIYLSLFPSTDEGNCSLNISSTPSVKLSSNIKLPKLELPTFSGDCKTWPTFRDMFNSIVHNQSSLSNVEKMQYLLSSLSNEPLNLVKGLPLTNDNYATAYDTLVKRYDNKRRLATSYWQEIRNASSITTPSTKSFRKLLDTFEENLSILEKLGFPVKEWDFILLNLFLDKLDKESRQAFEIKHSTVELPTYLQLKAFIENRAQALEFVSSNINSSSKQIPISKSNVASSSKIKSTFVSTTSLCLVCDSSNHYINKCPQFLSKSSKDRFTLAKNKNLCINCLRDGHRLKNCTSSSCKECGSKHHTLLHFSNNSKKSVENPKTGENPRLPVTANLPSNALPSTSEVISDTGTSTINTLSSTSRCSTVLLSTAEVEVLDSLGQPQIIRVLLDSASQGHFITEKMVNRLNLSRRSSSTSIQGLGQQLSLSSKGITSLVIRPRGNAKPSFMIEAMILPKICANMPTVQVNSSNWEHIEGLPLADTRFANPGPIDLLLGADIFPLILKFGRRIGKPNEPVALNTEFGYVLMGKVDSPPEPSVSSLFVSLDTSLNDTLKQFWELETLPSTSELSAKEIEAETIFKSTVSRNETGRYVVSLPFDGLIPKFDDSRSVALHRFESLERKLQRNPTLKQQYIDFMDDYEQSNHMEIVNAEESCENVYYIPHHCVLKPDSLTTKLRVVFDASAKTPQGLSLNDHLLTGPKLQTDVVTLLLRFRLHPIAITSDIKQMYRQILVQPSQRDFQRILWRSSPDQPIKDYRLNTVTYGVSSAPYLAIRTLLQVASDEEKQFSFASDVLRRDIYVDDVVTGCESFEEAKILVQQLTGALKKAGFVLHKWASNNVQLLSLLTISEQSPLSFDSDPSSSIKVLGLQWFPSEDVFTYKLTSINRPCTKRAILSELARIFDPLGFLTPLTFFAKHLMQLLWCLGLQWDETPPSNITNRWIQYRQELSALADLRIPRFLFSSEFHSCQLHGFADASELGYAAVVYVRIVQNDNSIVSRLVMAKSKVAPLKTISIPRLELCAATLLSDLLAFLLDIFENRFTLDSVFAWSDSKVALAWLKAPSYKWKTFVANRVSHIQDKIPPSCWRHVPSNDNPADCASRGLLPLELINHSMWWSGPSFLQSSEDNWPQDYRCDSVEESVSCSVHEEDKKFVFVLSTSNINGIDTLLNRCSSLNKILRVISYCRRFLRSNCRPLKRPFTSQELNDSLFSLVKYVQSSVFADDIRRIQNNQPCSKNLRKLNPFLDSQGILRVGGRLANSGLTFEQKHPALLPRSHRLTELLISDFHQRYCHPGLKTLQFLLTQQFWILSSRRAIYHVLAKCLRCFRTKPRSLSPLMGDLPISRINQIKPFSHVGVDYGGPFTITLGKTRGAKTHKAYLCLFICFATKAVHLELASDLSSECFLAALRRFIARRGRCSKIYSDCGTNFVGASKQLDDYMQQAALAENLEWYFNPPSSPHFGGLWEAGIKSVKTHLLRVIGQQILTFEELYTIFVQIEALLNSRPLCELSSDPNDLQPLTPGHFLTLEPLSAPPCPDLMNISMNRLTRWQLLQRLHQDFWKRWHQEYLHTLQQRQKWNVSESKLEPGNLVLIKSENLAPLQWPLGRVLELHPGKDGIVRVATIKTKNGIFKRPLVKICPLPSN